MSELLIVTVSLKYLLQVENRDVSMKSMMINPASCPNGLRAHPQEASMPYLLETMRN